MGTTTSAPPTRQLPLGRVTVLVAVVVISAVAVAVSTLARPLPPLEVEFFDEIQALRGSIGPVGVVLGIATAVLYPFYAAVAWLLTPDRGSVLGTVGGLFMAVGGVTHGTAFYSSIIMTTYLTAPGLGEGVGVEALTYYLENPELAITPHIAGFLTMMVGSILVSIALLLARTVPIAIALAPAVLILVSLFFPLGITLDLLQSAFVLSLAVVAVFLWLNTRKEQPQD